MSHIATEHNYDWLAMTACMNAPETVRHVETQQQNAERYYGVLEVPAYLVGNTPYRFSRFPDLEDILKILQFALSQTTTCIIDKDGKKVAEGKQLTRSFDIHDWIIKKVGVSSIVKVGLEAGAMSAWHFTELNKRDRKHRLSWHYRGVAGCPRRRGDGERSAA